MKALSFYVHVPFCTVKCGYCDFNAYAGMDGLKPHYRDTLLSEIGAWRDRLGEFEVATIGCGGGTPGEVPASHIAAVIDAIRAAGTWKGERFIGSPQGTRIRLADGREVLNLCANNYLGLAQHPDVRAAAEQALKDAFPIRTRGVLANSGWRSDSQSMPTTATWGETSTGRPRRRQDKAAVASCTSPSSGVAPPVTSAAAAAAQALTSTASTRKRRRSQRSRAGMLTISPRGPGRRGRARYLR